MEKIQSWFLHIDLDAFFASVEQLDHPEYRGKPVIVGGKPEDKRSVVSTASYEARKYGVHSAMPTYMAYKLCPNGIFVHGRMERYSQISYIIMQIIKNYSPDFQQMSIDEAFIDITGTEKLFGAPEETARRIKDEIKEKTGLTVSIGIAPTKYLAKIASDINKPDGLFMVKPGEEESFMLGLPIKKIFGVGSKMQESLKQKGLLTTKDIHDKPLDSLVFMFGENSGRFLYDAVRGNINEAFDRKTKSHSISAEKTFITDITDLYTLETYILELCHGIMFRLLRENGFSRTVFIKLRYEDFSTFSIQKTYSKNILTLDSLYNYARELFEEKWQKGRGIRLLGVGLENIEKEEKPFQQDLFDDGTEKKQKVEKAILNLEKKHPEIKVHKARMLESFKRGVKLVLFMLAASLFTRAVFAEDNHAVQKGAAGILPQAPGVKEETEAPTQLFKWEIKGYWKGSVEDSFIASFGNNHTFSPSFTIPVFKQEIDLSAIFNINENWKLLVQFLDNYDNNTFTLSYKGDGSLKTFVFSNRNIIFPDYYSVKHFNYNPAGGANEAPGVYFHFEEPEEKKYLIDLLLRYDMTKSRNATYYGKNSVTDTKINLYDYVYGRTFVIPDENILGSIKDIYVEQDNGEYRDKDGIRYKKLSKADYITNLSLKTLSLSKKAGGGKTKNKVPEILITFNQSTSVQSLITLLGSYSNSGTYLGSIQEFFKTADSSINLEKYSYEIKNSIAGEDALKIQSKSGFSPFLYCADYDSGLKSEARVQVVTKNTDELITRYEALVLEKDNTFTQTDFFEENHIYTSVYNKVYSAWSGDYTRAENRYPFADSDPYVYLTNESKTPFIIRSRIYSKVSYYDIGKKASAGSVKVYVNGIQDKQAVYSSTSGFVTPSVNVTDIDKVYITWEDESNSFASGAFVAGAGFVYNFSDRFKLNTSLTARFPFAPFTDYATWDSGFSLYTALTTGITYETPKYKAEEALALSVENENIKDVFILNDINADKSQVYYHSEDSGYKTHVVPQLNFTGAPELSEENNSTVENFRGSREENLSGYKIPLEWNFNSVLSGQTAWASVDIRLTDKSILYNSSILELALKNDIPLSSAGDYELYLQLGVKAENDFSGEIKNDIPTWKLSSNGTLDSNVLQYFDFTANDWQFIKIKIPDSSRAKLISLHDARLIIVKKNFNPSGDEKTGLIYAGPYEPHEKNALIKADSSIFTVSTTTPSNSSPAAKKYFDSYYSDMVLWQNDDSSLDDDKLLITLEKYFNASSFEGYKYINYDFSYTASSTQNHTQVNSEGVTLILSTADLPGKTALKLSVPSAVIQSYVGAAETWHSIRVGLEDLSVWIDGTKLASSDYTLFVDKNVSPSCQKVIFNTVIGSKKVTQGTFLSGSIYFTGSKTNVYARNYLAFDYKDSDFVYKINDLEVIKNPEVHLSSLQNISSATSISAEAKAAVSVLDTKLSFDSSFMGRTDQDNKNILQNAGHSVQTEKPYFNFLSISELYRYSAQNQIETSNSLLLDFNKIKFPLSLSFTAQGLSSVNEKRQSYSSELKFNIPVSDYNFTSVTSFNLNQNASSDLSGLEDKNYFTGFSLIKDIEFSSFLPENLSRKNDFKSILTMDFKKVKPVITFSAAGLYKNTNEYQSSNTLLFTVPVSIGQNTLSFSLSRSAGKNQNNISLATYGSDLQTSFESFNNNSLIFTLVPFYDLFTKDIPSEFSGPYNSAFYSTKYDISFKRKLSNSIKDLFIPTNISFSCTRDIRQTEITNDIYQAKFSAMFNFVNLFGKNGKMSLTSLYNQDEYNCSFTSSFVLPFGSSDKTSYLISFYESYLMFVDAQNTLKIADDFTMSSTDNWKLRFTLLWNHGGNFSILWYLPKLIIKDLKEEDSKVSRKEIINLSFGKNISEFISSYEISHVCDVTVKKNYTITGSLGLVFNQYETKANTIDFKMSLGAKLLF